MKRIKPQYKNLLIGLSIALYLVVALSFTKTKAKEQRCTNIEFTVLDSNENLFVSPKDIQKILSRNEFNIIGYPITEINVLNIEKAIASHPSIEIAHAYSCVKGKVHLSVEQRYPIIRIFNQNGTGYYIDDKGFLMPLSRNYTARVPIVTGKIHRPFEEFKKQDLKLQSSDTLLHNLYNLAVELQNTAYWNAICDQIYIQDENEIRMIPKMGCKEIIFGQNRNFAKDFETLNTFYTEVLPIVGWNKYKTINLKYQQQIVCKE
jgi:cell division protein FtsQ